jgi:hypothetical protein
LVLAVSSRKMMDIDGKAKEDHSFFELGCGHHTTGL